MFKWPWKKKESGDLVPIKGARSLSRAGDDFDSLFDRFWAGWSGVPEPVCGLGHVWDTGLEDKGDEFLIRAEAPGFESRDFDVRMSGNTLTIKAEHKDEGKGKNGSSYRYGSFSRTMTLPAGVEKDRIDARYHNGILELHLPKNPDTGAKRIPVTS